MELDLALYALSLALLWIFSGTCVALEILSLGTGDRVSVEDDENAGNVDKLLADPVQTSTTLGITRALSLIFVVITAIRLAGLWLFPGMEHAVLFSAVFTGLSVLIPACSVKVLAVLGAERFAAAASVLVLPVLILFRPVALVAGAVVRKISPGLLKLLAFRTVPLKDKIEMFGAQSEGAPDEEQKLMSSVLDFGETRVKEVMVPRVDVVAIDVATDKDEAVREILEAGHSRIPAYDETIDRIRGTIHTKDLLRRIVDGEEFLLVETTREAFFVPESKKIDELLAEFRDRKQHLAIVVDEYGGTAGIVTLEDVLEEIVGDIQDEFDEEEALVERLDENTAVCNAKVRLDDLSEELGIEFPDDAPESLGGLLYQMIGTIPRVGDKHRMDDIEFEIQSVDRQRIDKVSVRGLSSRRDGGHDDND